MNLFKQYILMLFITISTAHVAQANQSWRFKVFYGDTEIGEHIFKVMSSQNRQNVLIEADFKVKILFINAYSYQHTNYETWDGKCLSSIHSSTDDNGETLYVQGNARDNVFLIKTSSKENILEGCVKTFAYWDTDILKSKALLNSQTGELMPVEINFVSYEDLVVRGISTKTKKYTIHSKDFNIDLWYSVDNEWLALNSTTTDGTTLRYQIQ